MSTLTYERYNQKSILLRASDNQGRDHPLHKSIVKELNGRWYPSIKNGGGWIIPIANEEKVKAFISDKVIAIQSHLKSRREQKKYHRAVSESDDDGGQEEETMKQAQDIINQYALPSTVKSEDEEEEGTQEEGHYSSSEDELVPRITPLLEGKMEEAKEKTKKGKEPLSEPNNEQQEEKRRRKKKSQRKQLARLTEQIEKLTQIILTKQENNAKI